MNTAIAQKTQEIAFALIRISAYIRRFELRKNIERLSYHLVENIAFQNPEMAISTIAALRAFVLLGKNIYEIETINARVIDRELETLENEVRRVVGFGSAGSIESLFTKNIEMKRESPVRPEKKVAPPKDRRDFVPDEVKISDAEIGNAEIEYGNGNEEIGNDNAAMIRRNKIIAMLSTAPEYRLSFREIADAFPEMSERMIRYDLKSLSESGKVVRQGGGGPSNYYQVIKEASAPVINL